MPKEMEKDTENHMEKQKQIDNLREKKKTEKTWKNKKREKLVSTEQQKDCKQYTKRNRKSVVVNAEDWPTIATL